jgi:4-diphosphocytidyl-2-C-methyl-D-erythritol kinase
LFDVSAFAHAKINLFLEVVKKRPDGFHEIDSVFQEVELADELIFTDRDDAEIVLSCNNDKIPTDDRNLVVQAAKRLQAGMDVPQGVNISLFKRIPVGGGLGGGSSNAATTLRVLNKVWELGLSDTELLTHAAALGSDVPFFLYGKTCLCRGRGEVVEPIETFPALNFVLVFPEWGISTPKAYGSLNSEDFGEFSSTNIIEVFETKNFSDCIKYFFNRFEETVFRFEEREGELYNSLDKLGFSCVRMSGSGSTFFCVVPENLDAQELADKVSCFSGVSSVVCTKTRAI